MKDLWRDALMMLIIGVCVSIMIWATVEAYGAEWTDEQIVNAIYLAEGGVKAKVPYGILSVKVKDESEARKVCLNTVRNNRKRYAEWGNKQFNTYLEFLASRYAPVGAANDPQGLNANWLKNVEYFLNKGVKDEF